MCKTKADENSLSLSLQVAITRKNTKITWLCIFRMQKNIKITDFWENFTPAQTAETRRSFCLSMNAGYEANPGPIIRRKCRRNRKGCGNIKWRSTMYTNPQCWWNSQATMLYGNQWYTCTHTKTMYDICVHNSLPTSAILALGLLEKKDDEQFCVGGNNTF